MNLRFKSNFVSNYCNSLTRSLFSFYLFNFLRKKKRRKYYSDFFEILFVTFLSDIRGFDWITFLTSFRFNIVTTLFFACTLGHELCSVFLYQKLNLIFTLKLQSYSLNVPNTKYSNYSQLSISMWHNCLSIGKYSRFIGQEAVIVNLHKRTNILW